MRTTRFIKVSDYSADDISMRICLYRLKNRLDSFRNWNNKMLLMVRV